MAITALPTTLAAPAATPAPAARTAPAPAPAAGDTFSSHKEIDEKHFTWTDLGKGLAGAAVGAAVDGALMTGSAYAHAGPAVKAAFTGLIETPQIGPWLKGTLTPALAVTTAAAVILAPVAAAVYGAYTGFVHGAEDGPASSAKDAVKDSKQFNQYAKSDLAGAITSFAETPLQPGQKRFDITPKQAGKALVAATAGAVIDGLGIGASTIAHIPNGVYQAEKELVKSDAAVPLKVGGTILLAPAVPLAAVAGVVGGAATGFVLGIKDGYSKGITEAVKGSVNTFKEFNSAAKDATKAAF